jgi:hypothetical protein
MRPIPHKFIAVTVSAAVFALLLARPAHAATFSLNPVADAFVTTGPTGNLSGSNYGGAGAIAVSAPLARGEFQSVMRFDLSTVRAAMDAQYGAGLWAFESINLTLAAASPNNAIFNLSRAGLFGIAWMQNDAWVEGSGNPTAPAASGITYSSLTTLMGAGDESLGTFSFDGATSGSANYTLGLTPGFWADAEAGNLVTLRLFAADNAVSYLSNSRTGSIRPMLTVVAVPEPGMLSLLAAGGAIVVCGVGNRRRMDHG